VSLSDKNFLAAGYGGTRQFIEIKQWIDAITVLLCEKLYYCRRSLEYRCCSSLRAEQPWLHFLHTCTLGVQPESISPGPITPNLVLGLVAVFAGIWIATSSR
jgi:hypothetical protein